MSDTRHPLRQMVKGSKDVEESDVETMQQAKTLLEDKDGRPTRSPLRF